MVTLCATTSGNPGDHRPPFSGDVNNGGIPNRCEPLASLLSGILARRMWRRRFHERIIWNGSNLTINTHQNMATHLFHVAHSPPRITGDEKVWRSRILPRPSLLDQPKQRLFSSLENGQFAPGEACHIVMEVWRQTLGSNQRRLLNERLVKHRRFFHR
jgi:hypothetical protein